MTLRQTVLLVVVLNLAYFGIEFGVAVAIGSVSLFADSVDFLEDASINLLIAMALSWSAVSRARSGMALAGILFVPAVATLWTAWQKFALPVPPAPIPSPFSMPTRPARSCKGQGRSGPRRRPDVNWLSLRRHLCHCRAATGVRRPYVVCGTRTNHLVAPDTKFCGYPQATPPIWCLAY